MSNFARIPAAAALTIFLAWPAASAMAVVPPYHPAALTTEATDVDNGAATLRGTVSHLDSHQFEYGLTSSYGQSTDSVNQPFHDGNTGAFVPRSATISGLAPGTVYHFRVNATGHGETANGLDQTFTTPRASAVTTAATAVGERAATLGGTVSHVDSYRFEYGLTNSYGASTASVPASHHDGNDHTVSAAISGLAPGTVYHFRAKATGDGGETATGTDQWFRTTAPPTSKPGTTATEPIARPPAPFPTPKLGDSVVVAPVAGTVRIRLPGTTKYVTLGAGDDFPVGTIVDTRVGAVKLTSAVDAKTTQSGRFDGAKFEVRQAPTAGGMTDLVLRGSNFKNCPGTAGSASIRAASARSKHPKRRLWSRDRGGKFRTHGRNSVATVRGTVWSTTDTCAGTRTTVREGSVAVFDRDLGKTVIVRPGRNYLARTPR